MEKYENAYCKYCSEKARLNFAEILICSKCNNSIHISCLKRQSVPGGLFGDTFFTFICQQCSETGNECFTREKMTWFQVIILVMYHLQKTTPGTANHGFFHWRIHLVTFIDKKWSIIFPSDFKRRKNWMGTISGSLSHFSPCFFTSGTTHVGIHGWWRLTFPDLTPTSSILIYNELTANKQINLKTAHDLIHIEKSIKQYLPELSNENIDNAEENSKNIDDFMEEIDVEIDDEHKIPPTKLFEASNTELHHDLNINEALDEIGSSFCKRTSKRKKKSRLDSNLQKSYFRKSNTDFHKFWKKYESTSKPKISNIESLRTIEENTLYSYILQNTKNRFDHALKRKMTVRLLKRKFKLQYHNVDLVNKSTSLDIHHRHYNNFSNGLVTSKFIDKKIARGVIRMTDFFTSPYTNRLLKPYIRRDFNPTSTWLQLMQELQNRVSSLRNIKINSQLAPLDYCYVRPNHIPVINSLCEQYFWPGIDMSESLEYPEFSCVVLYKKLIVAFGFMIPDIKFNETYISFIFTRPEWRGSGIAKFMIYHLIQTCMGKDVTLHVAIDNPALFLYQKFGFKVEEVVFNFYDAYLRDDSKKCKHAFFLRLER